MFNPIEAVKGLRKREYREFQEALSGMPPAVQLYLLTQYVEQLAARVEVLEQLLAPTEAASEAPRQAKRGAA